MSERKCWRYIPQPCDLSEIKEGDFFKMDRANDDDTNDPADLFLATSDANPIPTEEKPYLCEIRGHRMIIDQKWMGME